MSLALVYNDLRDIVLANVLRQEVLPEDTKTPSIELGQAAGMSLHLLRLQAGTVHELLQLIAAQASATSHGSFQHLLRLLTPEGREAWTTLQGAASERWQDNPLSRVLFFLRNKIGFHYDAKELGRGYSIAFESKGSSDAISRRQDEVDTLLLRRCTR